MPGYRLFLLERFGEKQIRSFLGNMPGIPREAEDRYRLLDEVKDLLGLSENPRMLGFIAAIEPERLREAREQSGEITAAKLYEVLFDRWLDFEHARRLRRGRRTDPEAEAGRALVRALLAVLFRRRNARTLFLQDMREVLDVAGLAPEVVEHMIGSGSLLGPGRGRAVFVRVTDR